MEIVIVVAMVVVSVIVAWRMRASLEGTDGKIARAIAAATPTSVSDVVAGTAHRIDGTVRAAAPPGPSPATGRPCVAYDVGISAFAGDSPSRRSAHGAQDFLVEDGTGTILVRSDGAAVAVERDLDAPRTTLDQVPFADQVLRSQGVSIGSPTTCRIDMAEGIIAVGDRVSVLGHVDAADDEARSLGATFVLRAAPDRSLLISRAPTRVEPS